MRASLLVTAIGCLCVPMLSSEPAHAQALRTWVSGLGDDVNQCTRSAPCKTFAGAISKTLPGGIINCLDPGGFGAITITKSITLDCTNVPVAGVAGVNITTGGITVILRGLDIEGTIGGGANGINVTAGAVVKVEHCRISQFQPATAHGIRFAPTGGSGTLIVSDTEIFQNGTGILVLPDSNGALVSLQRVQMLGNSGDGFTADGATGFIKVSIADSLSNLNGGNGFTATGLAGPPVLLDIQRSTASLNSRAGINADGKAGSVFIGASTVTANGTGFGQANGGVIRSYGNNAVDNNSTSGSATPPILSPM